MALPTPGKTLYPLEYERYSMYTARTKQWKDLRETIEGITEIVLFFAKDRKFNENHDHG